MALSRRRLGDTGLETSVIGFGGAPLGSLYDSSFDADEGIRAVHEAFRLGVNFFDTAPYYGLGKSEEVLGRALKELPRSEVVVATKVGRYGLEDFDFSAEKVTESIHTSLERLQLEYIDLIQCHDIEFVQLDQIIDETIPALLKAKEAGLVKHVGITGLPLKIFPDVLDSVDPGTVDTVLSYCHHTLFNESLVEKLPYFQSMNVGVINASSLSMGLLSPGGPPEWHPASQEIKDACKAVRDLCKEREVSLPTISLFHAFQNQEISTTLVGMSSIAEVQENVETVTRSSLSENESLCLQEVKTLLEPIHNHTWPSGLPENN